MILEKLLSISNEIALALSILLTAAAQVLLRIGARNKKKIILSFLNVYTISGYLIFVSVILLMIYAMQKIPLRDVIAWVSITYILTPLAAKLFANDPYSKRMAFGSFVIVIGIIIFSI